MTVINKFCNNGTASLAFFFILLTKSFFYFECQQFTFSVCYGIKIKRLGSVYGYVEMNVYFETTFHF